MINFENTSVYGEEAAIRGMRNPMNSWDKSDSSFINTGYQTEYSIGENDFKLMKNLVKAGSDHSKFMRMIIVTVDITAPLYWWAEHDTYKVGTVRNSCSKMHKLLSKPFEMSDFSFDKLAGYKNAEKTNVYEEIARPIVDTLNELHDSYFNCDNEEDKKRIWYSILQLLPESYNQRATVQLNYAVLRNMYHSRKNHKLDEWSQGFTEWVESLPYSELITHYADENKRMKEQIEQLVKKYE